MASSSNPTFMVLGASGRVGCSVIKAVSSKYPSMNIIAGVRDPSSGKACDLKKCGKVNLVAADMSRPESLTSAIPKNLDCLFINTPGHIDRTKLTINAINAAKNAKVKHMIVVSVLSCDMKGSIFGDQFSQIEEAVKRSGVPFTIIRLSFFMDNCWMSQQTIKSQGKYFCPSRPDAKFTPIAVSDIGEAVAYMVSNPTAHADKTYRMNSMPIRCDEIAKAFCQATGGKVEYVQVPYDAAKSSFTSAGMPEWQADGVLELYKHVDSGASYYTYSSDFNRITGRDPMTFYQWAQQVGPAFKPEAGSCK